MPTTAATTFSNASLDPYINAEDAQASMVAFTVKPSVTIAVGTLVGIVTATGAIAAYATGNSDGTQNPVGFLRRAVVTDASGNITNQSEWGANLLTASVYTQGTFLVSDLTGLDAGAVTALNGRYIGPAGATRLFTF